MHKSVVYIIFIINHFKNKKFETLLKNRSMYKKN